MASSDEKIRSVSEMLKEIDELREQGDYYKNILESADKGVWVINDRGKTVYINYRMATMLGYTIEEILGDNIYEFIDEGHRSQFMSRLEGCKVECNEQFDMKFLRRDGKELWALAGLKPFFDKTGSYIGVNGSFVDITDRKHMEIALKETRDNLEKAQRIGKMGSWVRDLKTNTFELSGELCDMLSLTNEQRSLDDVLEFVHADDREKLQRTVLSDLEKKGSYKADIRIVRKDGRVIYSFLEANLIKDMTGKPIKVVGILQDITERKLAEEARLTLLNELKERVKELTALHDLSSIIQASGNTNDVLQKIALILPSAWQYQEIAVARLTYDGMGFTSPGFRETPWAQRADFTLSTSKKGAIEIFYLEEKPPEVEGPFLAEERKLINSVAEMTKAYLERKHAEEGLLESEEKFRTLAETSPAAIFFHSGESFIYANPAACKIVDRSFDDLSGMKFWDLFDPEYRDIVKERGRARLRGEDPPQRYDVKLQTKDGEKWLDITSSRVKYKGQTAILTVGMDVTQGKNTEIALREAKANAEFFIDIISHDIGNLNQAILGYLELARDSLSIEGDDQELIAKPIEIINKSSRLIKDVRILRQIRSGTVDIERVDAGELLARAVADNTIARGARINYPPPGKCYVMANEALGGAFYGIISNMVESGDNGNVIDINTDSIVENGRPYCKFIVEDNGPGIPDDLKMRMMSDVWEQNGMTVRRSLGWKFVKALVEAYHGKLWMEDRVEGDYTKGIRIVILLPAAI